MAKIIDLTSQRFGRLYVICRDLDKKDKSRQAWWKCRCDCGNEISVRGQCLRNGNTQSCGCLGKEKRAEAVKEWLYSEENKKHCQQISQKSNLLNQRFGKLLVIEKTDLRKYNNIIWKCRCDCGNITYVPTNSLTKGDTKSCGCMKSFGEEKISSLLLEYNIPFKREYIFNDCIFRDTKSKARFDFYVNNQYIIEYDGKQHFEENDFFQQSLENVKEHDNYKNQYCKINNIPIIRIPFTHLEKIQIEDLLLDKTKFLI